MKQRAVEKFYSVSETAFLLGYGPSWVRGMVNQLARFGRVFLVPGKRRIGAGEYRISATAINGWIEANQVRSVDEAIEKAGIYARDEAELRRALPQARENGGTN